MLRKSFSAALILFSGLSLNAQIGGSAVFPSLDLPLSARSAALGGKAVGIWDNDINLATWNPALLSPDVHTQMAFSFADYISDVKYGYAAFGWHQENIGTFNLFATRIDYGTFKQTDNTGQVIGEFTAGEYGINLGYARPIDSNFTFGANLKFIQSNLYLWKANGIAADLAVNYHLLSRNFSASVMMRNIGVMTKTYIDGNKEKLPFEIEAGLAFKPKHMPFRFSISFQHLQQWDLTYVDPDNPPQLVDPLTGDSIRVSKFKTWGDKAMRHVVIGGELLIGKAVSLRFGYNYMRRKELIIDTRRGTTGFTFGIGIKIYKFNISYARVPYHLAGPTNTFTVTSTISDFYKSRL
jgi:hypothetical protein